MKQVGFWGTLWNTVTGYTKAQTNALLNEKAYTSEVDNADDILQGDIDSNSGQISINLRSIGSQNTKIAANLVRINNNKNDIVAVNERFTEGILFVYMGVFIPGTTKASAGELWGYDLGKNEYWLCQVDTTTTPSPTNTDWKDQGAPVIDLSNYYTKTLVDIKDNGLRGSINSNSRDITENKTHNETNSGLILANTKAIARNDTDILTNNLKILNRTTSGSGIITISGNILILAISAKTTNYVTFAVDYKGSNVRIEVYKVWNALGDYRDLVVFKNEPVIVYYRNN